MTSRNQATRIALLLGVVALFSVAGLQARTWTSADGAKTFGGELKSYDAGTKMVTVTMANGNSLTFTQDKLSEADIAFVKAQGSKSSGGMLGFGKVAGENAGALEAATKEGKYEEFRGNVASVHANPLSKADSSNGHYSGNAETCMNVGLAPGRAMAELVK